MELTDIFNDSASRLTDFLAAQADGKTEVNMKDALERVTLDVIAKVTCCRNNLVFKQN